MPYCTQQNLIDRHSVDEIAQLAVPKLVHYLGEAASAATLAAAYPAAAKDDLAFARSEGEFYLYSGTTWAANPLAKIAGAIADADAEINAYLAAYLPLSVVPPNLVRIACDIARYHLYDDQMIDAVEARYKAAIKYLEQVAAGKIPLAPDSTGAVDAKTLADIDFQSSAPVFSGSALDSF